VTLMNFESQNM